MTTLREAAQQALAFTMRDFATVRDFEAARALLHDTIKAALAEFNPDWDRIEALQENLREHMAEIQRLRAKMATGDNLSPTEPVQEPVAWLTPRTLDSYVRPDLGYETSSKTDYGAFPVYTAPPQRKPLTDEEILHCVDTHVGGPSPSYPLDNSDWINFARAIERRAHGIKE